MAITKGNEFECSAVTRGIEIELTNYCGMKCIVCPRENLKNYGFMDFNVFKEIVKFTKEGNYEEIMVCGLGDAFLHKQLFDYIDFLFEELPGINLFFMTKGQAISDYHLDKLLEYKKNGFNVSLTFSVFSLERSTFNYLTGGNFFDSFIKMLKKCHKMGINYSLEFMLSTITLKEFPKFKVFAKSLGKDFGISLVHNWGGSIGKKLHKNFFNIDTLTGFFERRGDLDVCEVMKYDYLFISHSGHVYQCSLNYSKDSGKLGNILDNNLNYFLNRKKNLNYKENCQNCFYYNYKTFS